MHFPSHEIMVKNSGPAQWTPQASSHTNRKIKSLALVTNIIENTPSLPIPDNDIEAQTRKCIAKEKSTSVEPNRIEEEEIIDNDKCLAKESIEQNEDTIQEGIEEAYRLVAVRNEAMENKRIAKNKLTEDARQMIHDEEVLRESNRISEKHKTAVITKCTKD